MAPCVLIEPTPAEHRAGFVGAGEATIGKHLWRVAWHVDKPAIFTCDGVLVDSDTACVDPAICELHRQAFDMVGDIFGRAPQ